MSQAKTNVINPQSTNHDLIRKDQEQAAKIAHMQSLVTEGLESGTGNQTMEGLRDKARRKARS